MWGCGKVPGPASHSLSKAGIISEPVGHPLKDPLPSKAGGRDTPTEGLSTQLWPQKPSGQEVSLSGKTLNHPPPPAQLPRLRNAHYKAGLPGTAEVLSTLCAQGMPRARSLAERCALI